MPSRFNKTGRRVLRIPLDERRVCAPAYKRYWKARDVVEVNRRLECDSAKQLYAETLAEWIASYVARNSTPTAKKYQVAKFLAEQILAATGPMVVEGPGGSNRWSDQLGGMPELSSIEGKAWNRYVDMCRKADAERNTANDKADKDLDDMKRVLWREVDVLLAPSLDR